MSDSLARERLSDSALQPPSSSLGRTSASNVTPSFETDNSYAREVMGSVNAVTNQYRAEKGLGADSSSGLPSTGSLDNKPNSAMDYSNASKSTVYSDQAADSVNSVASQYGKDPTSFASSTGGTAAPASDNISSMATTSETGSRDPTLSTNPQERLGSMGTSTFVPLQDKESSAYSPLGKTDRDSNTSASNITQSIENKTQATADRVSESIEGREQREANLGGLLPETGNKAPKASSDAPQHVDNLATGRAGMAMSAPLAAVEKVSPAVASKLSQGAQSAAAMVNSTVESVAPHASNAADQVKNVDAGSYVQRVVDTAKAYLPAGLGGSNTTSSTASKNESMRVSGKPVAVDQDDVNNARTDLSTAGPDILSSNEAITPPS